jgi:thiol-disulfide isomerase/thioredoxin
MRTLKKLRTDKELNDVLKTRKSKNFSVLYYSIWDSWCDKILVKAEEWQKEEGEETVYLVNSWDLPASFASFSITSAPSLVHLKNRKVRVDVEYPKIYNFFHVTPQENS